MLQRAEIAALRARLRGIEGSRVLVYGDLMLDEYLFGRAERLSPERPVPVVSFERRDLYLGGAGNVVRNLRALDCDATLVARIGEDETGRLCLQLLEEEGLSIEGLVIDGTATTPRKIRVHAGQHALVRIDYETLDAPSEATRAQLHASLSERAVGCDGMIVSDYRKGTVDAGGVRALRDACPGIPLVADPKGSDVGRYSGVDYLVPNESELDDLVGERWSDDRAESLRASLGLTALVLTRSDDGVRVFADGQPPRDLKARSREVFDVTGAGDTFVAAFTLMISAAESLESAVAVANAAAGLTVRKVGTATVSRAEIASELGRDLDPGAKRVDLATCVEAAETCRAEGGVVVFTNGCFDLLHAGHIRYLDASRAEGDLLIVGLNSDASVTRIKGEGRPILNVDERSEVLAALSSVDHVVVFDEDTPIDLIAAIRPDVLTKGADYELHEVVGADLVQSSGGRVRRIDLVAGKSTSAIIEKITNRGTVE